MPSLLSAKLVAVQLSELNALNLKEGVAQYQIVFRNGQPAELRQIATTAVYPETISKPGQDELLVACADVLVRQTSRSFEYFCAETQPRWFNFTARPLSSDQCLVISEDITARKAAEQEQLLYIYTDPLTKLPNREKFLQVLEQELEQAGDFYVMHLHIKDFNGISSRVGAGIADNYLIETAEEIKMCLDKDYPDSILARPIGHSGFYFYLPQLEYKAAQQFAKFLVSFFGRTKPLLQAQIIAGVNIGVTHSSSALSALELLQHANEALEQCETINERIVFYAEQMTTDRREKELLDLRVRSGLANQQFIPYFQPKVSAGSGEVRGYEVLARWQTNDGQILAPSYFMESVRRLGKFQILFEQILDKSCAELAGLPENLHLSINISPAQFDEPYLFDKATEIVESYNIDPKRIQLEILEDCFMDGHYYPVIERLHEYGFSFAVDDFGKGSYTNLRMISNLAKHGMIDTLKIDQDLLNNQDHEEIVQTIFVLAQKLRLKLVAEGIENYQQYRALLNIQQQSILPLPLDTLSIQGYFFSRPLSIEDAQALPSDEFAARVQVEQAEERGQSNI
jgi:EAL domain-containing protein (putative c-di-GMP-specific phosphodiesterase class I)